MAVKEWFRKFQPVQLYLVLFFTAAFFVVEIVASYITHALTLLMNAYHMLCNIIALIGCIASIKYKDDSSKSHQNSLNSLKMSTNTLNEKTIDIPSANKFKQARSEKRMKNTFGWARIDIVTMLVCCVLLASFCFSLIVEALQTLVHIDHLDAMHHPLPVMSIGASGILLNAFCYFLIGGYTFNQGIFLHFTQDGDVVLKRSIDVQSTKGDQIEQSRRGLVILPMNQGLREMCRDVLGCVLVMIASCMVYFTESHIAKYIDPIFAIISAISLFLLSYPYMKESGLILLQTIPNHINIDSLQKELLIAFPDIVSVHDLHVWQLNGEKVISTVHIIYADPTVCARITDQITAFFIEMGITHVTIQPEFCKMKPHTGPHTDCLIKCQSKHCNASTCCSRDDLDDDEQHNDKPMFSKKFGSKEILPASSGIDLTKFTMKVTEVNETSIRTNETQQPPPNLKQISACDMAVEVSGKDANNFRTVNVDVKSTAPTTPDEGETITECSDNCSRQEKINIS
ncbi:PREDICTED: zinc/cadmium resistance protein [Ceratosolen solmsi marchali]|uniref:Zinc/cadmium resistance protein n=1 Tax=Ceratosolen solmsi marchali TaxID=326594 RepID=A0AAJ7DYP6_9HYME|nr:PREDICTED: zinc/cadmium resistance protein [Ceratosolen solmsi marchali]